MPKPATLAVSSACLLLTSISSVFAAEPAKLIVQPARIELAGSDARHRLLVTAVAADGTLTDVTAAAKFASKDGAIAAVSPAGECVAKADGQTEIVVSVGGQSQAVAVTVKDAGQVAPVSFLNDVMPILTRQGCNQGACHGKGAGQNGFRLSLRGYAPEWDYGWLTREFAGRRIDTAVPENSLLLQKPLGVAPHEGGKALNHGSREYQLLVRWISEKTPGPVKTDASVKTLEVLPRSRILKLGQEQPLLVRAEYSDGTWRDVTWLTKFESNDAGVIDVTPAGVAKVLRHGETAIRASFQGLVGVVILTAPYDQVVPAERFAGRNNFIDEPVFKKLQGLRIEPSDLCSDEAFIRRVFLDTIGTLPTPAETRAFLADKAADKRAKLIDGLLSRPEYVDYWALQLADLFQNRRERDHDVRGTKGVRAFHAWLREQVAANRPWDELARSVLTATGASTDNPAVGYFIVTVGEKRDAEKSEVVASVAQAFLGTRIGCAECHNHPLEKYTQDDYYHFAAFFSRVKLDRKNPVQAPTNLKVGTGDAKRDKSPVGVTQPRTGQFLKPQPLDRSQPNVTPESDPRALLAEWMTNPSNEYFAGAMVNRIWKHYLSVGLVEPVDDLRASNPPTNPELWQTLLKEFTTHKFDLKHLTRVILNSRTYQLSADTRPTNVTDTRFYSHYYARRLPAEVFNDALSQSTEVAESYPGYPMGVRAIQLPDPGLRNYFLTMFGRSERVTACACERSGEVTMPQLLHLQNGDSVVKKVRAGDGRLGKLLAGKATDDAIIEELYLATLCQKPNPAVAAAVKKSLAEDKREEVFRDLFWALLNSKEFAFNH